MRRALGFMFFGYLLLFVRIEIGIDLMPDPLGYLLIALGCLRLERQFPMAKKAGYISAIMIIVSFPTFFVNVEQAIDPRWHIYSIFLLFIQLILVYYTFLLLKEIVSGLENNALTIRIQKVFTSYIYIHLFFLAFSSFSVNLSQDISSTISFVLIAAVFIVGVVFLVQLYVVRNAVET